MDRAPKSTTDLITFDELARRVAIAANWHEPVQDRCGRICFGNRKINLSAVFAGQKIDVKQVADQVWLVSFMHYDLGFFDSESCRVECADNPFGAKVLPMPPE